MDNPVLAYAELLLGHRGPECRGPRAEIVLVLGSYEVADLLVTELGQMRYDRSDPGLVIAIDPSAPRIPVPAADRHGRDVDTVEIGHQRAPERRIEQQERITAPVAIPAERPAAVAL